MIDIVRVVGKDMVGLYAKQAEWDSFWRGFFFKEIGFETQFSLMSWSW